jgi:hypothetical protein
MLSRFKTGIGSDILRSESDGFVSWVYDKQQRKRNAGKKISLLDMR